MIKRNTKQKEEVLNYLKTTESAHISVSDIQNVLQNKVGLTTIYRILNELVETGTIIKKALENKQGFCYQYIDKKKTCNEHYHVICEECNDVLHCDPNSMKNICKDFEENYHFAIDKSKVVFYGQCQNCIEKHK